MDDFNDCIGNINIDDPYLIDDNIYIDDSSIEADNSHENSYVNEPDNLETGDSSQVESVVSSKSSLRTRSFV